MAIIGPRDLPVVLKVDSNPLKLRVMHHFGYPTINVELSEDQLEELLRVTGDFIATYFPMSERYAYFYTKPLIDSYDFPADAYWIKDIGWDPVMNRIQDIFGAEMFLFCFGGAFKILRSDNELIPVEKWDKEDMAVTPYGDEQITLSIHDYRQPLIEIAFEGGNIMCTPNTPIKVDCFDLDNPLNRWVMASTLKAEDKVVSKNGPAKILSIKLADYGPTVSVNVPSGCFYGCNDGLPILVH
jgi:hypothetical protein